MKFNCSYTDLIETHKLVPNPKNANIHSNKQIEMLAKIIDFQGQRSPIVVSKESGFIVKGHARLKAIKLLGWEHVAVDYQSYETPAQEYADLIADNKIAEFAIHDDDKMKLDLKELNWDMDIELLGLESLDLGFLNEGSESDEKDDVIPNEEEVDSICKLGDLWQLGEHRLLCGDCTVKENVEKLMDGQKADMVFTDPPYGLNFNIIGDKSNNDFDNLYSKFVKLAENNLKDDSFFWCATGYKKISLLINVFSIEFCDWIVWKKNLFGLGKLYKSIHESILVFRKGKPKSNKNKLDTNLWEFDSVRKFGKITDSSLEAVGHPTQKPTALIVKAITDCTNSGIILDSFLGSGSTLIACEKTNRKCYGMELDPHYCDVIIKRWEDFTGNKAAKL